MPKLFNKEEILTRLLNDSTKVKIDGKHSYHIAYPEFIKYFNELTQISYHNLVIAAHFTYGWMPTAFDFRSGSIEDGVNILNTVKHGNVLTSDQLNNLLKLLNNSLVGTSKVLHFIAPEKYPIWDSRVYRYVTKSESHHLSISNIYSYLNFTDVCNEISTDSRYNLIHDYIIRQLYPVSKIRSLELIMFTLGKKIKKGNES